MKQLIPDGFGAEIHTPDPTLGFESFVTEVHRVIENDGNHAIYVFDCLSDLASVWLADQMLGNFFLLTCPRLYDLETVTYFGIYRNHHVSFALGPITETTQFLLDVFRYQERLYVRPIKVQHRSTSSMNTIHLWEGDEFRPITTSAVVSEVLASSRWPGLRADTRIGFWRRIFHQAQQAFDDARAGRCPPEKEQEVFEQLSRMVLSRDEAMIGLVHRYLSLGDILEIRDRMIGIGLIGGKSLGMLLCACHPEARESASLSSPGDSRFFLHRFRCLLHVPDPQRRVVAPAEAAGTRARSWKDWKRPGRESCRGDSPTTPWTSS